MANGKMEMSVGREYAVTKICDKCGVELDVEKISKLVVNLYSDTTGLLNGHALGDICDECMRKAFGKYLIPYDLS